MNDASLPVTADAAVAQAWLMLAAAVIDRKAPMHTLVVATTTPTGLPDQRVMVLRAVTGESLRFHSDARSPKIVQIAGDDDSASIHILGYDAAAKVQLRLSGRARIEREGTQADAAWAAASLFARRAYMTTGAPGRPSALATSGLPSDIEGRKPSEQQIAPARANFAIILADITRIDWLWLASSGHRRAVGERDPAGEWSAHWVLP